MLKNIYSSIIRTSWHLGFVVNGLDGVFRVGPLDVQWVVNPYKDRWFADPFILDVTEKEILLLVEEYRYFNPVGRIAKLTVDKDTLAIVKMDIVLETGSHLSFPNILRKNGNIYIYPENANAGHQDIYEYDCSESKATFVKTICNECIWDAAITDLFGKQQMFTARRNDYFLDIYEWNESEEMFVHNLQIESKLRNSRMGGSFFIYQGEIYAPFQNCERTYGGNIDLKRITYSNGQLSFETVKQLFSPHKKYNEGLHTLNEYKGVVVIDVKGHNHFLGKVISKSVKTLKRLCR